MLATQMTTAVCSEFWPAKYFIFILTFRCFQAIRRSRRTETGESGDGNFVTKVNSYVMAASVVGQDVIDLKDPVTFTLVHDNEV